MHPNKMPAGERFFRIYHDQDGIGFFLVPLVGASAGGWEFGCLWFQGWDYLHIYPAPPHLEKISDGN